MSNFFERLDAEWDKFKANARVKWAELKDTDWNEIERDIEGRWDRFTDKVKTYYNKTTQEIKDESEDLFDPVDDNEHEDFPATTTS